jgi:hypothetical protein
MRRPVHGLVLVALVTRAVFAHVTTSTARPVPPAGSTAAHSVPVPADSFRSLSYDDNVDVLISPGSREWRDVVSVVRRRPSCNLAERVVEHISTPGFEWTTDRHALYPTTDVEVYSLPWLEEEMAVILKEQLLPAFASLYRVDARRLFLRDQFIVKYSNSCGAQSGLESHHDESCFSFVMQLNDPACFAGGGTLFEHAEDAISVPQGDTLLFCGYNKHMGVPVTEGTRYILTGFVDYRADTDSVRVFWPDQPTPHGAGSNDFPSPHLGLNRERLSEAYDGLRGEALLRAIAYLPPRLEHVDMTQLRTRCANWLEHGMIPSERFYAFLQATVGSDGRPDDDGSGGARDGAPPREVGISD